MTLDLENAMKAALDGKFYSFSHNDSGGIKVFEKEVPKDYCPKYNFTMLPLASGSRGGLRRAARHHERVAMFWTAEKVQELRRLRSLNYSARRMGYLLGISRHEVGVKLNKLGIPGIFGKAYHNP